MWPAIFSQLQVAWIPFQSSIGRRLKECGTCISLLQQLVASFLPQHILNSLPPFPGSMSSTKHQDFPHAFHYTDKQEPAHLLL